MELTAEEPTLIQILGFLPIQKMSKRLTVMFLINFTLEFSHRGLELFGFPWCRDEWSNFFASDGVHTRKFAAQKKNWNVWIR